MVFRRFRAYRPPFRKNIVQNSNFDLVAATQTVEVLVTAPATLAGGTSEVLQGARIKAIWLELYLFSGGVATARNISFAAVFKNPGGILLVPSINTLGASNVRGNTFFFTRGIPGTQVSGSPLVWRGWLRVPKKFQVFHEGDLLQLILRNDVDSGSYCFLCIYKWSV